MKSIKFFSLLFLISMVTMACARISPAQAPVSTGSPSPQGSSSEPPAEDITPRNARSITLRHASRIERDLTYCILDGVALKADIYFPQTEAGVLLIYIHGGGWRSGSKNSGSGFMDSPALLDTGFTLASIDYRLAPEYQISDMITDVKRAVRYFRTHAAEYDIDPDHIGVWGTSAGGHLVSMLGTADETAGFDTGDYLEVSSRVQAVVSLFGPANLQPQWNNQDGTPVDRSASDARDLAGSSVAAISPVTYVTADDPPFLLLHGDEDKTVSVRQSQDFYDLLTAAGVDAQLVVVKGGSHGLNKPDQMPSRAELTRMIVEFFESQLK